MPFTATEDRESSGFSLSIRTLSTRDAFIEALAEEASVTKACKVIGVSRRSIYDWRDEDPAFAAAWAKALERGTESLEDEATRRAKDGTERKVYYKGEVVGSYQEYSDPLIMFMLRAQRPEKYRDRSDVNVTGSVALEKLVTRALSPPTIDGQAVEVTAEDGPKDGTAPARYAESVDNNSRTSD